jgi:hypothetical protein
METVTVDRAPANGRRSHRQGANGVAGGHPPSRDRGSPGVGSRSTSKSGPSRVSMTSRQKRRMRRTQESARELRELQSQRRSLIPVQVREPDYWRDISVEIAGTIFSAMLIFGFGHIFGYIEHPSGLSELPRLLGLVATLSVLVFAFIRSAAPEPTIQEPLGRAWSGPICGRSNRTCPCRHSSSASYSPSASSDPRAGDWQHPPLPRVSRHTTAEACSGRPRDTLWPSCDGPRTSSRRRDDGLVE